MAIGIRERVKEGQKPAPTRVFSKKQETTVAAAIGGHRTPNSGATMFGGKGDVLTEQWILECKTKMTHSESISIKKEWLKKQKQEAAFMGKPYSAIVFNFGPDEPNYYILEEWQFQEYLELLKSTVNKD